MRKFTDLELLVPRALIQQAAPVGILLAFERLLELPLDIPSHRLAAQEAARLLTLLLLARSEK